jgi:hypothetical protein
LIFINFHGFGWILIDLDRYGYGYLAIWLSGYLDIWISGYLDIWINGYMDIWIYGYMAMWMYINDDWVSLGGRGLLPSPPQTPPHPHIHEGLRPSNSPSI